MSGTHIAIGLNGPFEPAPLCDVWCRRLVADGARCPMNLIAFPFDTQECTFTVGEPPIGLRLCYAMSGTWLRDARYWHSRNVQSLSGLLPPFSLANVLPPLSACHRLSRPLSPLFSSPPPLPSLPPSISLSPLLFLPPSLFLHLSSRLLPGSWSRHGNQLDVVPRAKNVSDLLVKGPADFPARYPQA
eukprot:73710-Rhodomonas_salina.2